NPTFSASISGFVLGQDRSVLRGALDFSTPADDDSLLGSYVIAPGGLAARNYTLKFVPGVLTVADVLFEPDPLDPTKTALFVGGTAFDNNEAALQGIMAEWASASDYATRIAHLMGSGVGLNRVNGQGVFLLAGPTAAQATIYDDTSADILTGSAGQDWFWAN